MQENPNVDENIACGKYSKSFAVEKADADKKFDS